MKNHKIIIIGLCVSALLCNVAYVQAKDKVPNKEVLIQNDEMLSVSQMNVLFQPDFVVIFDNEFNCVTANDFIGSSKSFTPAIAEMFIDYHYQLKFYPNFKDPAKSYKKPYIDVSWIWKFQHYHNC